MMPTHTKPRATEAQVEIARDYGIPLYQAYTINIKKYGQFMKFLQSPIARLERWFDRQEERRILERGDEHNGG